MMSSNVLVQHGNVSMFENKINNPCILKNILISNLFWVGNCFNTLLEVRLFLMKIMIHL